MRPPSQESRPASREVGRRGALLHREPASAQREIDEQDLVRHQQLLLLEGQGAELIQHVQHLSVWALPFKVRKMSLDQAPPFPQTPQRVVNILKR
jgi:hypothetical protein